MVYIPKHSGALDQLLNDVKTSKSIQGDWILGLWDVTVRKDAAKADESRALRDISVELGLFE